MKRAHQLAGHLQGILEAGRVLSKDNESKVRGAIAALQEILSKLAGGEEVAAEAQESAVADAEALLEADLSHSETDGLLRKTLRAAFPTRWTWLMDVYDTWLVFQDEGPRKTNELEPEPPGGKLYRVDYTIDDAGAVTLGTPVEVRVARTYVDVAQPQAQAESEQAIEGEFVPLVEKAVRRDNTVAVKLIQAGWGSSGYYPAEVLKRDGPVAFKADTKMYWNHPTATEEAERPERDLRDLAAVLVSDARWEENGAAGPGLYADAKVFDGYKEAVEGLAPHIGVSIRALGAAKAGEADGRKGPIIEKIAVGRSVDFVTTPGAGGQILQLFESARGGAGVQAIQEVRAVNEQEAQALQEANTQLSGQVAQLQEANTQLTTENARLRETALLREARDFVTATLAEAELPEITRTRLIGTLAAKPVVTDGKLDEAAYKAQIEEAVAAEVEYLAKVTGSGQVRGLGATQVPEVSVEEAEKALAEALASIGLSESQAQEAARGR